MLIAFLLSIIAIYALPMTATEASHYKYTNYQTTNGLCDNYVYSTYEDKSGFIWICTSNGLDRFDGHEFIHYNISTLDLDFRLKSNLVRRVLEDDNDNLWGISDAGLIKINLITGNVSPYQVDNLPFAEYLSQPAKALFKDTTGSLWIAVEEHVLRFTLDDQGNIIHISHFLTPGNRIAAFTQQDNTIWAGGNDGIRRYVISSPKDVYPIALKDETDNLRKPRMVQALLTSGRNIWIGTSDGLYSYSTTKDSYQYFKHDEKNDNSLTNNKITSLAINTDKDILIGSRNGISTCQAPTIERLLQKEGEESLSCNLINDLMIDSKGRLWVSTAIAGVDLITDKHILTTSFFKGESDSRNLISCLCQDKAGNLLAGVINKGLGIQKSGSDTYSIHSFSNTSDTKKDTEGIFSVVQDFNDDYWIATAQGIRLLKKEHLDNPRFEVFNTGNSNIGNDCIVDLVVDSLRRGIWACQSDGLVFLDLDTKKFHPIKINLPNDDRMRTLMTISLDREGNLWIGGNGIYIIPLRHEKHIRSQYSCLRYPYLLSNPAGMAIKRISSIVQAKSGKIYIGSLNGGLYEATGSYDKGYTFISCPLAQESINPKVSHILEGRYGGIWVSTLDGVYYYNVETNGCGKFDLSEGLPNQQFYIKSGCILKNGQVCLGTSNGAYSLNVVSGSLKYDNRNVVITSVTADNQWINVGNYINHYDVYPGTNILEIAFSAIEYTGQHKLIYGFKIDKVDKEWNIGSQHKARYTNLPPGEYTFRVKCTNIDNKWSKQETILFIYIHPAFYQMTWFIVLMTVLVLLIILLVGYLYIRHQKAIQRQLENKVLQRTEHLNIQKKKLEEKTQKLSQAMEMLIMNEKTMKYQNEQLKSQNEEIKKNKDLVELFMQRQEKANKEKMAFFTSLTHEFKTPLTLILGPMQKIAQQNRNPMLNQPIQIASRNAQYLLSLVEQIMDMHRADAQQLKYTETSFNIQQLFEQDLTDFANLMDERHLTLRTIYHLPCPLVQSDKQFIHTILLNLVSNAVKYTPNGGTITIYLGGQTPGAKQEQNRLFISVNNTDSYIDHDEQEKIFQQFYKIEKQSTYPSYGQSSTGIGLSLIKQILEIMQGNIKIKSTHRTGTTFRICLPITMHPADNQLPALPSAAKESPAEIFTANNGNHRSVILLVEDNQDMREYIKDFLCKEYEVVEAINGEKGLELALQVIPDFIISDLMMPRVDGFMFCQNIRSNELLSHIPFLMLTALSDDEARTRSYSQGVDSFLTKPFKPEILLARIENIRTNIRRRQNKLSHNLSEAHTSPLIEDSDKAFLKKLKRIMDANYKDCDFGNQQLLQEMGMSNTALYRKIIALTGLSTSLYIRIYRLQIAKEVIDKMDKNSQFNISELAYAVGFSDPKYFTRCFVKQYGMTPTNFIRNRREQF